MEINSAGTQFYQNLQITYLKIVDFVDSLCQKLLMLIINIY